MSLVTWLHSASELSLISIGSLPFLNVIDLQAKLKASVRVTRSRVPVEEDPLELRLGLGGTLQYSTQSVWQSSPTQQQPRPGRRGRLVRQTIDLTTTPSPERQAAVNEDCVLLSELCKSRKRKLTQLESSQEVPPISSALEKEEEHKLKCPICMDTMKEETSTMCGHIFCRVCIQGAIKSQKKCPTCRKRLKMKNIHRIYI
uniref:RING-type domain-containing protein n=1 Tax=Physcomitrium patens TaxID=3218 RepID=A0A7I4BJK9_PHYPA